MDLTFFFHVTQVAIGVGLIIFVHELGHFLVAKKVGIRVETFSLGFGPRVFGFTRGDTDYRLSLIPLGGYVKMAGENPDDPHTGAADEFGSKSVGARAAVISAGVIMNLIFAVLGFLLAFKIGVELNAPVVGAVAPGSAAHGVLERGDIIKDIDGEKPLDFVEVSLYAAFSSGDGLNISVDRRGETKTFTIKPRKDLGQELQRIGIEPIEHVAAIEAGSAAEAAGFAAGDRILGLNGFPIERIGEFVEAVYQAPKLPLSVEVWRSGKVQTLRITPTELPVRDYGLRLSAQPAILRVVPDGPADQAGVQAGDIVTHMGIGPSGAAEEPAVIDTVVERIKALAAECTDAQHVVMRIQRGGKEHVLEINPLRGQAGAPVVGLSFGMAAVDAVMPGSAAAKAGLKPGDRLVQFGDHRVFTRQLDLEQLACVSEEASLLCTWIDADGSEQEAELVGDLVAGRAYGTTGLQFAPASFMHVVPGVVEPIRLGFQRTWMFLEQVFMTIGGMVSGRIDASVLGGPILIGKAAYDVAQRGVGVLIYFLCLISVNLAVINILPVPLLDGGHLVFLAIEKVKGSPVSPQIQGAFQWVGLAMLLGLMVFVTHNDILRIMGG